MAVVKAGLHTDSMHYALRYEFIFVAHFLLRPWAESAANLLPARRFYGFLTPRRGIPHGALTRSGPICAASKPADDTLWLTLFIWRWGEEGSAFSRSSAVFWAGARRMFDTLLGLAVAAGVFGFLVLSLLRPGKF